MAIRIIIGFECSDTVRSAFEAEGFDAWSCDLLPSKNPNNKKHIQADITTIDTSGFSAGIFFPPCTDIANSGAAWFEQKRRDGRQKKGIDTFMWCTRFQGPHCIENPVGIMSSIYRKPDQTIEPYYFGDEAQKRTCLWLNGLPKLAHYSQPTLFGDEIHVGKGEMIVKIRKTGPRAGSSVVYPKWNYEAKKGNNNHGEIRSVTFPGIARAMALQWGKYLKSLNCIP